MGKVNTWLQEKLAKANPHPPVVLRVIVEVEEGVDPRVVANLISPIPGTRILATSPSFIRAEIPSEALERVSSIEGVRTVSYDAPVYIKGAPSFIDPLLGTIHISAIEVPYSPREVALRIATRLPLLPMLPLLGLAGIKIQDSRVEIIPSSITNALMGVPPEDNKIKTKVAVLDTGLTIPHPLMHPTKGLVELLSTTGEPPFDGLSHGEWVATCAWGDSFTTRFGLCRGVADPEGGKLISIKCLSNMGSGSTWGVLLAMQMALDRGAKVINMSLGSSLQGAVSEDPLCQIIQKSRHSAIWVVASGNDGEPWTIGSPGASPFAVTVGAWSTKYDGLAIFSSRGPSGIYYRDHPEEWTRDLSLYGQDLIKPDCVAPGGGPVKEGDIVDLIYSGASGWVDGTYDYTPDGFEALRGSSMSTPAAAGLISWAYDRKLVRTAADVKEKLSRDERKDDKVGYGFITLRRLTNGREA